MHKIAKETIDAIRSGKQAGQSLQQLSEQYHIAKATVSYYCRDLFSHPNRVFQTEDDIRKRGTIIAKRFICRNCGTPTKSRDQICAECYQKRQRIISAPQHKKANTTRQGRTRIKSVEQACAANTGKMADQTQQEPNRTCSNWVNTPIPEQSMRSLSPTHAHHWIIDSEDIGTCKYCNIQKNMVTGKLLPEGNTDAEKVAPRPVNTPSAPAGLTPRQGAAVVARSPSPANPQIGLTLKQRYFAAWDRIMYAVMLASKGKLTLDDVVTVSRCAKRQDIANSKAYDIDTVQKLEHEALSYPPVPADVQSQLDSGEPTT